MALHRGDLIQIDKDLRWINEFNSRIYGALSIDPKADTPDPIQNRQFFVSRTKFDQSQYQADSLRSLLAAISVDADDYKRNGLFILRSTVMNPFYPLAHRLGKDFLFDFVRHLHKIARRVIEELWRNGLDRTSTFSP
jgi:hypothetical protein